MPVAGACRWLGQCQGAAGQVQGPGVGGDHHLGRRRRLDGRLGLEDAVLGALVAAVAAGVAAHAPEAVVPLAPDCPFGGVEAGVGEGDPHVVAVAGHRVIETAVPEQPEVGHAQVVVDPVGGPPEAARLQQVRSQPVEGLQHGQPAQRGLHSLGGGRPGRMLVGVAEPVMPVGAGPQEG